MAEAVERKFGQGAVYGSLAYDFGNPELYPPEEYGRPAERAKPQTQTRTRVRTRARTQIHTRQGIAPTAILGIAAAAFLLVTAITAQASLFAVAGESVELQAQIEELEERQTRLRIAYESAFNLAEVEDYAVHTLGMQKPTADQIYYIDTSSPDRAVVIENGASDGFVDRAADFISGIGDAFGG